MKTKTPSGSEGVPCPACQHKGSQVHDTRSRETHVHRRRTCCQCDYRFTTIEITADRYESLLAENKVALKLVKAIKATVQQTFPGGVAQ